MCIAIAIPANTAFPTDKIFENCFSHHDDGAGYAWAPGDGKVHFSKGHMTVEEMIKNFRADVPEGCACLIHFRTGTGGKGPEYTHPFCITDDLKSQYMLKGTFKGNMLIHNGIFSGLGKTVGPYEGKHLSDTQEFVIKYAIDPKSVDAVVATNKIASINPKGAIVKVGQWIDVEGISYSNSSYSYAYTAYTSPSYYDRNDYVPYSRRTRRTRGYLPTQTDSGVGYDEQGWPVDTQDYRTGIPMGCRAVATHEWVEMMDGQYMTGEQIRREAGFYASDLYADVDDAVYIKGWTGTEGLLIGYMMETSRSTRTKTTTTPATVKTTPETTTVPDAEVVGESNV